jgi:hypothetical protein
VLRQLPSLAKQHAIVLGEAVPAPTYVRIRDATVPPESHDPDFMAAWTKIPARDADDALLEEVSANWARTRPPHRFEPDGSLNDL